MDEAKAANSKSGKTKKTSIASLHTASQKTLDIAAMLRNVAPAGSRLIVDMPLSGKGEIRLVLTEPARRISVFGADMDDAMRQMLEKLAAEDSGKIGRG